MEKEIQELKDTVESAIILAKKDGEIAVCLKGGILDFGKLYGELFNENHDLYIAALIACMAWADTNKEAGRVREQVFNSMEERHGR